MHNVDSPSSDDGVMEQRLQALGKVGPRVTPLDIDKAIDSAYYFTAEEGASGYAGTIPPSLKLLTFCVLVLKNGFTVTGESACVSPETFDAEFGRSLAYTAAKNKLWPLLSYALRDRLSSLPQELQP